MLRTITIGNYLSIQGALVRALENGKVIVRVGDRTYEGVPVAQARPQAA